MRRPLLVCLLFGLVILLCAESSRAEEAPYVVVDTVPANWVSQFGLFQRHRESIPTGQTGYYGILPDGTLSAIGPQEVYVEAYAGGTGYGEMLVTRADFVAYFMARVEPLELRGGGQLTPHTQSYETTFAGYPTTVFEVQIAYAAYSYVDQTCNWDGSGCEPTGFIIWESSHTQIERILCVEVEPGAPCVLIEYVVSAETSDPAQLGENPETPYFAAAVQDAEAFVNTWRIEVAERPIVTPEYTFDITGVVTAPTFSWQPDVPLFYPLTELRVALRQQGRVVAESFTTPPDGAFHFAAVPSGDEYTIELTLQHAITNPPYFQIVNDQSNDPITLTTYPFALSENSSNPRVVNLELGVTPDLTAAPAPLSILEMRDAGMIYYYAREGWQMAAILLGQTLDMPTLNVRAFSTLPLSPGAGAYWAGPMAHGSWYDPIIELDATFSNFQRRDHRGTVLHEFGHHIMADSYDNLLPHAQGDTNHGGFANATTTDSFIEGFATFFAIWTQRDQLLLRRPALWDNNGAVYNLEMNYLAWSSDEELAVASLLWDMIDPIDTNDCTPLPAVYHVSQPVITTTVTTDYCDRVTMKREDLWYWLTQGVTQFSTAPASAPAGFNYLYDVAQLYEVLSVGYALSSLAQPEGDAQPAGQLDPIDELFIAHGFFGDINPQNLTYDVGEPIGFTPNKPFIAGTETYVDRNPRRSPPPLPNSYIGYQAVDAATGAAVDATQFHVAVIVDAPYAALSYEYETSASAPGRLLYVGPPAFYPAHTTITPVGVGVAAADTLTFTNEEYWTRYAEQPATLWDHIFTIHYDEDAVGGGVTLPNGGGTAVIQPDSAVYWPCVAGAGVLVGALFLWLRRGRRVTTTPPAAQPARQSKAAKAPPIPMTPPPAAPARRPAAQPARQNKAAKAPPASMTPPPAAPARTGICPHCGGQHSPQAKFCAHCGGALAGQRCVCGQAVNPGARFCRHCGRPFGS